MRLDVRVPLSFSRAALSGRGITASLASQNIRFEAAFDPPGGASVEIQLELLGSGRRLDFRAKVNEVASLPQRNEKLLSIGDFDMSPEDTRAYAAWLVERGPLVVRPTSDAGAQAVRGAMFEVSADFSEVKVAWPTRAVFARSFRDELSRNTLRVRTGNALPRVGTPTLVTMLIPQGIPTQVSAVVTGGQRGEVELRIVVNTETALRLASYARG